MENRKVFPEHFKIYGFVYDCLISEAISSEEVARWAENKIASCDDLEQLEVLAELVSFKGSARDLWNILEEWNRHWYFCFEGKRDYALMGIVYKRGVIPYEHTPKLEARAKKALEYHPEVEEFFREVFPFIEF